MNRFIKSKQKANGIAMPRRVWDFANALFIKLKIQFQSGSFTLGTLRHSVFDRALLRQVSFPHLAHIHSSRTTRFLSFDSMIRQEIRARIARLIKLRDAQAQAIGLIVTKARIQNAEDLPRDTSFLIDIMELSVLHSSFSKEDYSTEDLDIEEEQTLQCPNNLAIRLTKLSSTFGRNRASFEKQYHQYSRPSRIVRYWPVCVLAYIIGSTASKYVWNRRQDITTWLGEMVQTVESFWLNWIVEPTRNILATIRHDAGSEVALLSSRSLGADLDSLERMVVEFAKDNPQFSNNMSLEALKLSARNGDVTPVLVAYEDNIKSPLRSAITGSLIRALLIQIQKTKVDVEVAINGIDKLLKSQELVFGFIGVSPALAFVWVVLQWSSSVGGRRGKTSSGQLKLNTIKTLRNVDRLLCKSHDEIMLTYKERGLILCEAQILRSGANCIVTGLRDQYLQDLEDLESASTLRVTRSVLNRILSVYSGSLIYP